MQSTHTPGPWTVGKKYKSDIYAGGGGKLIARAMNGSGIMDLTTDANARLIAAAPDMLAALQRAQMAMLGYTHRNDIISAALADADAAIARAGLEKRASVV